jgi:hypothetical protein
MHLDAALVIDETEFAESAQTQRKRGTTDFTQYPWFFSDSVRAFLFRIQQIAILLLSDEAVYLPVTPRRKRLPPSGAALYPDLGSAMDQLKQMFIQPGKVQAASVDHLRPARKF